MKIELGLLGVGWAANHNHLKVIKNLQPAETSRRQTKKEE
jgi:hypothetical protein